VGCGEFISEEHKAFTNFIEDKFSVVEKIE
jgi:hypothetical protein